MLPLFAWYTEQFSTEMPNVLRSPHKNESTTASNPELATGSGGTTQGHKKRRRESDEVDHSDVLLNFRDDMIKMFQDFEANQNRRLGAIESQISHIKDQNDSIKNLNTEIEKSVSYVSEQIEVVQNKIMMLEEERKEFSTRINAIGDKCDMLEKNLYKTSIEIRNVPKIRGEKNSDLYGYIENLKNNLGMTLQSIEIRDIFRIPNKKDQLCSSLIVELNNTLAKSKVLDAAKSFNKTGQLNSNHLGLGNKETRIYISERLTPKARRLHFLARDIARLGGFKYCWTAGGNVYLRKADGDMAILIRNEENINELRKNI